MNVVARLANQRIKFRNEGLADNNNNINVYPLANVQLGLKIL